MGFRILFLVACVLGAIAHAEEEKKRSSEEQSFYNGMRIAAGDYMFHVEKDCAGKGKKTYDTQRSFSCVASKIENDSQKAALSLGDLARFIDSQGKNPKSPYYGFNMSELSKDEDGNVTWKSFQEDLLDFIKKKKITSFDELAKSYPKLFRTLNDLASLEGSRMAFMHLGNSQGKFEKNYCYSDQNALRFFPEKILSRQVEKIMIADDDKPTSMECQVRCAMLDGRMVCWPVGDTKEDEITLGKASIKDFASDCAVSSAGCNANGKATDFSQFTGLQDDHLEAAYKTVEGDISSRTNTFLMDTMLSGYMRMAKMNANSSTQTSLNLKILEDTLDTCGEEEADEVAKKNAKLEKWNKGPGEKFVPKLIDLVEEDETKDLRKKSVQKKKKGATALAYFKKKLKDQKVKTGKEADEELEEYHGRIAQAAECTQRLAERYMKFQYLLSDNDFDRGLMTQQNEFEEGSAGDMMTSGPVDFIPGARKIKGTVAAGLVSMTGIGALSRAGVGVEISPPLDVSDGDHLQPLCGTNSYRFTKNLVGGKNDKDKIHLKFENVAYDIDKNNVGRFCTELRKQYNRVVSELDQISNEYQVLFSTEKGDRASFANKVLDNLPKDKRDPDVLNYKWGDKIGGGDRPKSYCVMKGDKGAVYAMNDQGEPLLSDNCGAIKPQGKYKSDAVDATSDPSKKGMTGGFLGNEPTCMDIAKKKKPTSQHVTATRSVLDKLADPKLKTLAEGIKQMACGDKGPDFYNDLVTNDPTLMRMYLMCSDYGNVDFLDGSKTAKACLERQKDAFWACIGTKLKSIPKEGDREALDKKIQDKASKKLWADFLEGVTFTMEVASPYMMGMGAANLTLGSAAIGAGMGVVTGVAMTNFTEAINLVPTAKQKKDLVDNANWDQSAVMVLFASAESAVVSVKAATDSENEPDPYTSAIVMGVVFGAFAGGENQVKGVPKNAEVNFSGLKDPAAFKAWSEKKFRFKTKAEVEAAIARGEKIGITTGPDGKIQGYVIDGVVHYLGSDGKLHIPREAAEAMFVSETLGGLSKLANMDVESRITMYQNWRSEMLAKVGKDKILVADEKIASTLATQIYDKYGLNVSNISLERLSVEDRLRMLSDPNLAKLDVKKRYIALTDSRFKDLTISESVEVLAESEKGAPVKTLDERITAVKAKRDPNAVAKVAERPRDSAGLITALEGAGYPSKKLKNLKQQDLQAIYDSNELMNWFQDEAKAAKKAGKKSKSKELKKIADDLKTTIEKILKDCVS